jgi:SAM-dependent methyltransferase
MELESLPQCILCGCKETNFLVGSPNPTNKQEEVFSFVQCPSCGLIYLSPRPTQDEASEYYPTDYAPYLKTIEEEPSTLIRWLRRYDQYKRCHAVTRKKKKTGRILDIGCSTGIFLSSMKRIGWDTYGVEPSQYAASYARSQFEINVFNGFLENARFENDFFDVVTLWDVLEHVYDPIQTLKEIQRILKPDGLLLINIPNPDAWERKWFGKYWSGWDIPRHTFLFSTLTIDNLLLKADLRRVEIFSFTGRHGAMIISLQSWLDQRKTNERYKKVFLSLMNSIVMRVITYPFYNVANWLNKSSYMTVYARNDRN